MGITHGVSVRTLIVVGPLRLSAVPTEFGPALAFDIVTSFYFFDQTAIWASLKFPLGDIFSYEGLRKGDVIHLICM
jgi:hypothetical protein